jgi:hypothetical protein
MGGYLQMIRNMPQHGGKLDTLAELETLGQSKDRRVDKLFGRVELSNFRDYFKPGYVPPGRDDRLRDNDARSIDGLPGVFYRGLIDRSTVVIGWHGHPEEIQLALVSQRNLDAQGRIRNMFEPGDGLHGGKGDAQYSLDQRQTYANTIDALQGRNRGGGAVYLGVDAHGIEPPVNTMPTAAEILAVMGKDARVVVLTEAPSGHVLLPSESTDNGPMMQWLRGLERAGIPVKILGIDSRRQFDPQLLR